MNDRSARLMEERKIQKKSRKMKKEILSQFCDFFLTHNCVCLLFVANSFFFATTCVLKLLRFFLFLLILHRRKSLDSPWLRQLTLFLLTLVRGSRAHRVKLSFSTILLVH
jgi:hypothetical protein